MAKKVNTVNQENTVTLTMEQIQKLIAEEVSKVKSEYERKIAELSSSKNVLSTDTVKARITKVYQEKSLKVHKLLVYQSKANSNNYLFAAIIEGKYTAKNGDIAEYTKDKVVLKQYAGNRVLNLANIPKDDISSVIFLLQEIQK